MIPSTVSVADVPLTPGDWFPGSHAGAPTLAAPNGMSSASRSGSGVFRLDEAITAAANDEAGGVAVAEFPMFSPQPAPSAASTVVGETHVDEEPARASWPWVLLCSYASAMTLACAYLLWFAPRRGPSPDTLPADSRPDLGGSSRTGLAPPIPRERLTTLGQPLRIGSLEWTPLTITAGRATLERQRPDGGRETSDGGAGILVLTVRFRNLSTDAAFAPLDRAFVREPDRGLPESLIELDEGGVIDIYPLAVESERAIVGQSFAELKPGATLQTIILSDKDAAGRVSGPATWRLRVRVGPGRTEIVGVRFDKSDIR